MKGLKPDLFSSEDHPESQIWEQGLKEGRRERKRHMAIAARVLAAHLFGPGERLGMHIGLSAKDHGDFTHHLLMP